jgi:hypothetical protein
MTALEDVVREAHDVADESSPEWPMQAMAVGEHLEAALASADALRDVSLRLVRLAEESRCDVVAGASDVGHRIAAAAVALADNGLKLFSPSGPAERVMLIDGALATGAQLIHAVRRLRAAGARDVLATVVLSVGAEAPELPEGLGAPKVLLG